jgi:hypothetical protein
MKKWDLFRAIFLTAYVRLECISLFACNHHLFATPFLMAPKVVSEVAVDLDPEFYETKNVHAIYDQIAHHFSSTRYKVNEVVIVFFFGSSLDIILELAVANHCKFSFRAT